MESIFRSISILNFSTSSLDPESIHYTIGFSHEEIKIVLDNFVEEEVICKEISLFADSVVHISFRRSEHAQISFRDSGGTHVSINQDLKHSSDYGQRDESCLRILESFPIFSLVPYLRDYIPFELKHRFWMPHIEWHWNGWDSEMYFEFITQEMNREWVGKRGKVVGMIRSGFELRARLQGFWSLEHKFREYEDDTDELWEEFLESVDAITEKEWLNFYGMVKVRLTSADGINLEDYWYARIDPDKKFILRKRKVNSEN